MLFVIKLEKSSPTCHHSTKKGRDFYVSPKNNVRNNVRFLKSNSRFPVDNVHFFCLFFKLSFQVSQFFSNVKFQLKSEQGWAFFMQKLQLYSGQGDCIVNKLLKPCIKSYNLIVDKRKSKDRVMFHTESYNFTVNKTT